MKKNYFIVFLVLIFLRSATILAQVGIGTTNPNASASLEIASTNSGILIPRMTDAQKTAIASPATGLMVYQTDGSSGFYYFNGTVWTPFGTAGWSFTGNAGTNPASNFIGTTDGQDFVIKTNNAEVMRVKNGGNVGINTPSPTTKLHIVGPGGGAAAANFSQNFNTYSTGFVTLTTSATIYQILNAGTCTTSNAWKIGPSTSPAVACSTCSSQMAFINNTSTCSQDDTMVYGSFTATSAIANVSFNYSYDDFSTTDSFVVTLYNETTATTTATLINLTSDSLNQTFSSAAINVIIGNSYSLRFRYIGNFDWGATVDNMSVTFAAFTNPALRIVDGAEAAGKVLVSDALGNATWGNASSGTDNQSLSISGANLTISGGNTVVLPGASNPTLSISGNNLSISGGNTIALPTASGYTFTNGLTNAASTIKLGGTLTETTNIGATAFDFNVASAGKTNMFQVDFDENVVKFGHDTIPYDDGTTKTIDGNATTVDYMTSCYNGNSRGSTVGIGSLEYFTDGEASIACSDSFLPIVNGALNLGSASSRWNNIYSVNVVNVSDSSLKKNITPINYGLKELMLLKPVSYNWKENKIGNTIIPEKLQEKKLGFLAQDLQTILPEVVKSHDWKITNEAHPKDYQYVKNEVLGVMYNDIIPVTVKAIQEQQSQIELLKTEIETLKIQNHLLMEMIRKK